EAGSSWALRLFLNAQHNTGLRNEHKAQRSQRQERGFCFEDGSSRLVARIGAMQRRTTPGSSRRSEASRRAILTAAFELAGEVGYAKLSIEGIAARAGVGKQTIYRWWPSKGAVLFDAILSLSEGPEGSALPDTGDLEAD